MKSLQPFILIFLITPILANAVEKADRVVVEKSKYLLTLYNENHVLASYHVMFGGNPTGAKQKKNDGKTPEGNYVLDVKKADSAFYKAIHISYPNAQDSANAKKLGIDTGGDIMIHGQKNGLGWESSIVQKFNWTKGCIALNNHDMDAVWNSVDTNTPIEIKP